MKQRITLDVPHSCSHVITRQRTVQEDGSIDGFAPGEQVVAAYPCPDCQEAAGWGDDSNDSEAARMPRYSPAGSRY
jgi:hypothetical protein